jgi:hypothetical protein
MKTLTQTITDAIWLQIGVSKTDTQKSKNTFKTPDDKKGSRFSVLNKTDDDLIIKTSRKSQLKISKESFRRALEYLIRHNHVSAVQYCEIGASKSEPSPLDLSTRIPQNKKSLMVIPYVLPILASTGVLATHGGRPNKVWLNI